MTAPDTPFVIWWERLLVILAERGLDPAPFLDARFYYSRFFTPEATADDLSKRK